MVIADSRKKLNGKLYFYTYNIYNIQMSHFCYIKYNKKLPDLLKF